MCSAGVSAPAGPGLFGQEGAVAFAGDRKKAFAIFSGMSFSHGLVEDFPHGAFLQPIVHTQSIPAETPEGIVGRRVGKVKVEQQAQAFLNGQEANSTAQQLEKLMHSCSWRNQFENFTQVRGKLVNQVGETPS